LWKVQLTHEIRKLLIVSLLLEPLLFPARRRHRLHTLHI
jgi:hypothetical protein